MINKAKAILLFDFDGTISDSIDAVFDSINELARSYGFREIRHEEYVSFREKSTNQIINDLKIPKVLIPVMLEGIRDGLTKRADSIKPVDGIVETLRLLAKRGYFMYIVTSNSQANVSKFLERHKITDCFKGIYADGGMYEKSILINKFISDLNVAKKQTVYIGDEVRDIEAGNESGTKTLAVTWGLNGKKVLEEKQPDWLIETPDQLLEIFIK